MNEIREMCRSHFNEPVLVIEKLVRLIGYAEDDRDCYLVVHCPERGVYWHTAVGGYVFLDALKGQGCVKSASREDWDDFLRLSSGLTMRGVPLADEFTDKQFDKRSV